MIPDHLWTDACQRSNGFFGCQDTYDEGRKLKVHETSADELTLDVDTLTSSSHRTPVRAQTNLPPKVSSNRRSKKASQVNKRPSRRPEVSQVILSGMEKAKKEMRMKPEDTRPLEVPLGSIGSTGMRSFRSESFKADSRLRVAIGPALFSSILLTSILPKPFCDEISLGYCSLLKISRKLLQHIIVSCYRPSRVLDFLYFLASIRNNVFLE